MNGNTTDYIRVQDVAIQNNIPVANCPELNINTQETTISKPLLVSLG